ncbi:GMP synthase [Thalassomonas sp. RHCl1]|uniref:glutamine amidotransferase-related protein n=1 Tax=Thalassomonas sp. RHCl1 TaxID=2995320 RepID=UPI00248AC6CD|nr:GMP synthase [Thalassomonas sp. RHCl1]
MSDKETGMKLGLLLCDDVMAPLQGEFGGYQQMFTRLLQQVCPDLVLTVYDVRRGEFPQNPDENLGYLTSGSACGVNDDLPWLAELEAFIRLLAQQQKKLVGICFGHQLLAKVLGGKVECSQRGWGIGVSFNDIRADKPWMVPASKAIDLVACHQDQVISLPPGAEVLAASRFCPLYMVQFTEHLLGIQGHPEFPKAYVAALMEKRRDKIPAHRIREGLASLDAGVDDIAVARWIINFIQDGW